MRGSDPRALGLILTAALAAPLASQDAAAPPSGGDNQILSVEFRGGSLADYVAVIRNAGEKINIVVPPMAADVRVPPLSILDADIEAALDVAAEIADEKHRVNVKTHRSKVGRPIHVIMVREVREAGGTAVAFANQPNTSVGVFSLESLTDKLPGDPDHSDYRVKAETILTAIDAGLEVAPETGEPAPKIRYHKDSGLLFVQGSSQQTHMVSEVLRQMNHDIERRRAARMLAQPRQKAAGVPDAESAQPPKKVR